MTSYLEGTKLNILIMAGGKGSRLGYSEKGLLRVCGKTIIERIIKTVSHFSNKIFVCVSKNVPRLRSYLETLNSIEIIEGSGEDYVFDLAKALELIDDYPILVSPSDMPFLSYRVIKLLVNELKKGPAAIINLWISKSCKKYKKKGPTGLSLFNTLGAPWKNVETCLYPDLLDVDTFEDLEEARKVCSEGSMEEFPG